jgi:hypothetical protein
MDSSGNAVPGRVIHFDLAGIRYDAVTGPDGCAQVNNIYRCLASAVYPFVASWDGDTCYAASSGNQTLTISCDPTNITDDASKVHVVQYSDPITLGAWLKDEESLELTGKLLTFTVGTQSCADFTGPGGAAGCQPDNDLSGRNGYASCGITINQPASSPGCTPITSGIAFTGDGSYCASTKPITVTIEPEHATIKPLWKLPITCSGPNGDGVTMKLNAHVIEDSDGSYGDITKAGPLDFDVTDPTGASTTYSSNLVAVPNPNPGGPPTVGYGEVSFPQMVGIYCVNVRLHQGNCHYSASPVKVTTVVNCGYISPIVGGAPQELNLRPATEPLKDGTGQIVVDPETGKPVLKPTWKNYMYWGNTCNPTTVTVTYQWATLVKTHPARKSTCDVEWCPDPLQQNGDGIKTHWPLLYEVDGTTWTLTVAYWTNKPVRTNPSDLTMPPTRYHQETFTWKVARKDWSDLSQAVGFFRNMAAGKCELSMISNQSIADRIDWYVDGNPNPVPPLPPIKGIKGLISGGYNTEARARFGALESYLAGLCSSGCDAASGCCKEPAADVVKIVNTCDAPVVNTLINIIWAIQRANGYTD